MKTNKAAKYLVVFILGLSLLYYFFPFFSSHIIVIHEFDYRPDELVINKDDKILWINYDVEPHDIISGNPSMRENIFNSKLLGPGQRFIFDFNEPGEYVYHCSIHPTMTAKIIVKP